MLECGTEWREEHHIRGGEGKAFTKWVMLGLWEEVHPRLEGPSMDRVFMPRIQWRATHLQGVWILGEGEIQPTHVGAVSHYRGAEVPQPQGEILHQVGGADIREEALKKRERRWK